MNGVFRYGKGIAAALTLSAVAFVLKTAPQWLFPYVDPLPGHGEAGTVTPGGLRVVQRRQGIAVEGAEGAHGGQALDVGAGEGEGVGHGDSCLTAGRRTPSQ